MSDFKTYNEQGEEIKVTKDDFFLCQSNQKISDKKFDTKATTFAKDAFKRFCKNKSSVVGAIIIGILLLTAFLLPLISPHNVTNPDLSKSLLPSKLLPTGTGFWDGTRTHYNAVYDAEAEAPAGYKASAVVKILDYRDELADYANPHAFGGTFVFKVDNNIQNGDNPLNNTDFLRNYDKVTYTTADNFMLNFTLTDTDGIGGASLTEYRVLIQYNSDQFFLLKDWSREYGEVSINISELMNQSGVTSIPNGQLRFEAKPVVGENNGYIGIETLVLSSNNEEIAELLEEISITNANHTVQLGRQDDGTFPIGYWQSTGRQEVYQVKIRYVDFIYDLYEEKLGDTTMSIGKTTIDKYIDNGWCTYDYSAGPESFVRLSDKCPIVSIQTSSYDESGDFYNITAVVTMYKYNGYSSMPCFWFGTNESGYDIVKLAFIGLRTSLLIAFFASAVCFLFGLFWGSISGYFGGNIDLLMERFCDILGGVPWIVVMTLAILLMGNTVVTFALALCLTGWMGTAARTRTQFYRFKGREYILASRTLGAKDSRLIFRHILPNALGTIVTSSVLMIPSTIFSEATLSYLNLGLQGSNSFGNILANNQIYLSTYPALILFPAVIISLLMISFNLFGNGLRDALNPSLKGSE